MALIFCEGFDDGLTFLGKWTSFNNTSAVVSSTYGRNGSGLRLITAGTFLQKQLSAADEHATMTVGFAWRRVGTAAAGTEPIIGFYSDNGATQHMTVRLTADGNNNLVIYRGSSLVATDTMTIVANQWYYIEFKTVLADAPSGSYELRVNGNMRLQAGGVDTKNAGTKTVIDSLYLSRGTFQNGQESNFDDLYLCNAAGANNTTFLGDTAIETILPNANGNSSQFVGNDIDQVDNYLLVDETTPSTSDFVTGTNLGDKDTYSFANMTRTSGTVAGVMLSSYANKSDSSPRSFQNVVRSGGTENTGASIPLTTTWTPHSSIFELDPNGGGNWTIGSVNSAEFGVEMDS